MLRSSTWVVSDQLRHTSWTEWRYTKIFKVDLGGARGTKIFFGPKWCLYRWSLKLMECWSEAKQCWHHSTFWAGYMCMPFICVLNIFALRRHQIAIPSIETYQWPSNILRFAQVLLPSYSRFRPGVFRTESSVRPAPWISYEMRRARKMGRLKLHRNSASCN